MGVSHWSKVRQLCDIFQRLEDLIEGRGLHSSTIQLNLSRF